MQAGSCYVVFNSLNSQENDYINKFITKKDFRNSVYSLHGYLNLDIIYSESNLSIVKKAIARESSVKAYFQIGKYKKMFYKGVCTGVNIIIQKAKKYIQIQTSHSTYRLRHEDMQPMEFVEDMSVRGAIQQGLSSVKCYERIINNVNPLQELNIDFYSGGKSQKVYNYLETVLKEIPARMFTTILNNKTTLYIYDTGSYLDAISVLQTLKNDQVLSVSVGCDYTGLIDEASVSSENSIDDQYEDSSYTNDASNLLQHRSIGIRKFLKTSSLDLGKINRFENTLSPSNSQDLKVYTNALIADAIDSSFFIRIEVPSLLKDINNPLLGTWELGAKIHIDNDLVKEVAELFDLNIYLNSLKYFFVIKNIEYNETSESMYYSIDITMNDVLRFL